MSASNPHLSSHDEGVSIALEVEYDSLYFRYEMAENYAKAQRNKRDFDKKMKILNREIKLNMQNLKNETAELNSSLLVRQLPLNYKLNSTLM